jgi:hypothetical protein
MPILQLPFGAYELTVFDESPIRSEIFIHLIGPEGRVENHLKALWNVSVFFPSMHGHKYLAGDYYQSSINADPERRGLGPLLLDFIATHKNTLGFPFNNLYSTNTAEDKTPVTIAGKALWDKMVRFQNATYNPNLQRYQLTWKI